MLQGAKSPPSLNSPLNVIALAEQSCTMHDSSKDVLSVLSILLAESGLQKTLYICVRDKSCSPAMQYDNLEAAHPCGQHEHEMAHIHSHDDYSPAQAQHLQHPQPGECSPRPDRHLPLRMLITPREMSPRLQDLALLARHPCTPARKPFLLQTLHRWPLGFHRLRP